MEIGKGHNMKQEKDYRTVSVKMPEDVRTWLEIISRMDRRAMQHEISYLIERRFKELEKEIQEIERGTK
jgi:hypothetical protein